jgi:protein-serine/threonine kinase
MHPPNDHHHQLKTGPTAHNASQSSAKRGWSSIKQDLLPLAAAPTEHQPLLKRDSVLSISEHSNQSFAEKYGRCHEIVHYGSNSTTRLHQNKTQDKNNKLLAIKVYRQPIPPSSSSSSSQSTSIHPDHPNILPILDILHNERSELCLVMPYCAGGDLGTYLSRKAPIPSQEADCIITQILRALAHLHKYEIAHRDIRLETVLLTASGAVKLAGFGDGHIRRMWEESAVYKHKAARETPAPHPQQTNPQQTTYPQAPWSFTLPWPLNKLPRHLSSFSCAASTKSNKIGFGGASIPYTPPEGFAHLVHRRSESNIEYDDVDPRPADVWATAMIYMALVTGRLQWRSARPHCEDARYLRYLDDRDSKDGYPPIESLGHVCICFLSMESNFTNF